MTNTTQNPTLTERNSSIEQTAYSLQKLLELKITKPYDLCFEKEKIEKENIDVDKCQIEFYDLNSEKTFNDCLCFGLFIMFYKEKSSDNNQYPIRCCTYKTAVVIRQNSEFVNEFRFFNVEDNAIDITSDWQNDMDKFVDSILEKMKNEILLNVPFESKPFNGFLID